MDCCRLRGMIECALCTLTTSRCGPHHFTALINNMCMYAFVAACAGVFNEQDEKLHYLDSGNGIKSVNSDLEAEGL